MDVERAEVKRERVYVLEQSRLQIENDHFRRMLITTGFELIAILGASMIQAYFIRSLLDHREVIWSRIKSLLWKLELLNKNLDVSIWYSFRSDELYDLTFDKYFISYFGIESNFLKCNISEIAFRIFEGGNFFHPPKVKQINGFLLNPFSRTTSFNRFAFLQINLPISNCYWLFLVTNKHTLHAPRMWIKVGGTLRIFINWNLRLALYSVSWDYLEGIAAQTHYRDRL